jgi:predicted branched-subunit amino acid permease
MIWLVWQSASIAGIFLAQWIPAAWGLEFVAILALIAMLLPMVLDRAALACITVAGGVAAFTVSLPLNLGLLLAVIAGVAAAMTMDWIQSTPREPRDGS